MLEEEMDALGAAEDAFIRLFPGGDPPAGKVPFFSGDSVGLHKPVRPRHVLLIEDDLDGVHAMAALLRTMGHHVDYAINGYVGIDVALRSKPEFIFLDIRLPDITGIEVCRRLRRLPEFKDTRIIVMTAYGQDAYREQALKAGAELVLVKPVEVAVIEALLAAGKKRNGGNGA